MKYLFRPVGMVLRVFYGLCVLLALASIPARADDYADVAQLVQAGQLTQALAQAEQFLRQHPTDPQMRFIKAGIEADSGNTSAAIASYVSLTQDYPELPEPYNNLAVLYAAQNNLDMARSALEMAVRTNPGYATAQENLGDVYAKLASLAYGKALQLDASKKRGLEPKLNLLRQALSTGASPLPNPSSSKP